MKHYAPKIPATVAKDLNYLALALDSLGEPQQALRYLDQALEIEEKVYRTEHRKQRKPATYVVKAKTHNTVRGPVFS